MSLLTASARDISDYQTTDKNCWYCGRRAKIAPECTVWKRETGERNSAKINGYWAVSDFREIFIFSPRGQKALAPARGRYGKRVGSRKAALHPDKHRESWWIKLFSNIDVHLHDKWSEGADEQKLSQYLFGLMTVQHNLWSIHGRL